MSEETVHGDEASRLISRMSSVPHQPLTQRANPHNSGQCGKLEKHYPGHGVDGLEFAHEMYQGVIYLEVFFRATARHGHKTMALAHGGSRDEVFYALAPRLYMREVRFKIEERDKDRDFRMCKKRVSSVV